MPKSTQQTPTNEAAETILALPPKRPRRRSTRASHSWRFRKPPSRKRVEVATARSQPQAVLSPQIAPLTAAPQ